MTEQAATIAWSTVFAAGIVTAAFLLVWVFS
jgi:hypothetical protein